jgi:thiol-disulfide isomerase/thioredoxin
MKNYFLLLFFSVITSFAYSQSIKKVKMQDVVNSFSNGSDTVYVVNFWATFCKPCVGEIPHFIKIVNKYKTQKVKLLLVSLDLKGYYPKRIASFARQHQFKTNLAWLSETNADIFCPMIDQSWSGAIPATVIINGKKNYKKFFEDELNAKQFEEEIKKAL